MAFCQQLGETQCMLPKANARSKIKWIESYWFAMKTFLKLAKFCWFALDSTSSGSLATWVSTDVYNAELIVTFATRMKHYYHLETAIFPKIQRLNPSGLLVWRAETRYTDIQIQKSKILKFLSLVMCCYHFIIFWAKDRLITEKVREIGPRG